MVANTRYQVVVDDLYVGFESGFALSTVNQVLHASDCQFCHWLKSLADDWQIVYSGVGKVNAAIKTTEILKDLSPSETIVINFGSAGSSDYKIGEALFNLGSSLDKSGDYVSAHQHFLASIEFAQRAHDEIGVNLAHLYLANVALVQGQIAEAKRWFSGLSTENLPKPRHPLFLELQTKLAIH